MPENKPIKISLYSFILIITILIVCIIAYFAFINNTNSQNNNYNSLILSYGDFEIDGTPVDPAQGTGISCITLNKDNTFYIELVYGGAYTGNYFIENNTLTCNADTKIIYEGGTSSYSSNTTFQFNIISKSQIELWAVMNNYESFGLCLGSTYSIK